MSYWPSPEDQTKPCRCGCGQEVGLFNKGTTKDFYSQECYDRSLDKAVKVDMDESGKSAEYSAEDVYRGKDINTGLTQDEHNKAQLKQKAAKLEMLGFNGEADRLRQANGI